MKLRKLVVQKRTLIPFYHAHEQLSVPLLINYLIFLAENDEHLFGIEAALMEKLRRFLPYMETNRNINPKESENLSRSMQIFF